MADLLANKVTAIVVRRGQTGPELLVFDHPGDDGGVMVQVPAGTVERGESPGAAVIRELFEESGVLGDVVGLVGHIEEVSDGRKRLRSLYVLSPAAETQDQWPFVCDCGVPIRCYWVSFETAVVVESQQPWIDKSREWWRSVGEDGFDAWPRRPD